MLSTHIPPVTCTRCGWQNEPSARMCGGCGMPLRTTDPGATSNADLVGEWASPALPVTLAEMVYPPDAPTTYSPQPSAPAIAAAPRQQAVEPAIWGKPDVPAKWGTQTPIRHRSPWWQILLIALVVLSVLVGGGLGAWALIVRPAIHAQVDTTMRASLYSAIDQVDAKLSQVPTGQTLQVTESAAELEQQIRQSISAGGSIADVRLHFANDAIRVTYALNGNAGAIVTHLHVDQRRLEARATSVDYPLGFVESGDEMEWAINDAFARLPSNLTVQGVSAKNDILTLQVRT